MRWSSGRRLAVLSTLALSLAIPGLMVPQAGANHEPADKIGVSGSVVEVMQAQVGTGGGSSGAVPLLSATLRTSSPTDLMLKVTAECAINTDIILIGNSGADTRATVTIWVEIDGVPVPVTADSNEDGVFNDPDDGRVVFCNRDNRLATAGVLPTEIIQLLIKTRTANAFNWVTFNVGSGIHTIVVKGRLDVVVSGSGFAQAIVGKRTLIVEPAKLANDAQI